MILRLPRTIFRGFSEGPPKSSILDFFTIFDNFPGTLRNSSKYFFDNFRWIRGFIESAGAGPLQAFLPFWGSNIEKVHNQCVVVQTSRLTIHAISEHIVHSSDLYSG